MKSLQASHIPARSFQMKQARGAGNIANSRTVLLQMGTGLLRHFPKSSEKQHYKRRELCKPHGSQSKPPTNQLSWLWKWPWVSTSENFAGNASAHCKYLLGWANKAASQGMGAGAPLHSICIPKGLQPSKHAKYNKHLCWWWTCHFPTKSSPSRKMVFVPLRVLLW